MLPDRVSNPGPLTYESGALPIALRGPAHLLQVTWSQLFKELSSSSVGDSLSLLVRRKEGSYFC